MLECMLQVLLALPGHHSHAAPDPDDLHLRLHGPLGRRLPLRLFQLALTEEEGPQGAGGVEGQYHGVGHVEEGLGELLDQTLHDALVHALLDLVHDKDADGVDAAREDLGQDVEVCE